MPLSGEAKKLYQRRYMRLWRVGKYVTDKDRYEGRYCRVCGYSRVVDNHHLDGNHDNNEETMSTVKLQDVTKKYVDHVAISGVTLECDNGELLVLLGRPGAGKTTALKTVAGIEAVTSGSIFLNDEVVNDLPPERRNVAMAFETYALYPHWSVRQNWDFPLRAPSRRLPEEERGKRIGQVAELLELAELLDRRTYQLSGGQRQRVSLGRALVRSEDVNVTLLDEPIAHLDARLRHALRGELRRYQRENGATTIYTTADYAEAFAIADKVAVLVEGCICQVGPPDVIYEAPADLDVVNMIGDPKMNIFSVASDGSGIAVNGQVIAVPGLQDGAVSVGVWPTDVRPISSPTPGAIEGTVYVSEPLGYDQIVRLKAGNQIINIKTSLADGIYRINQPLWLMPRWDRIHLFDGNGARLKGVER